MDEHIWDYHVDSNTLTILYPDGCTQITTSDPRLMGEFMQLVGDAMLSDYHLEVVISEYASTMERTARKPKSRVEVWREQHDN